MLYRLTFCKLRYRFKILGCNQIKIRTISLTTLVMWWSQPLVLVLPFIASSLFSREMSRNRSGFVITVYMSPKVSPLQLCNVIKMQNNYSLVVVVVAVSVSTNGNVTIGECGGSWSSQTVTTQTQYFTHWLTALSLTLCLQT